MSQRLDTEVNPDFLAIKTPTDLAKLKDFLSGRPYNFVHSEKKDRTGQPMIGLMLTEPGQLGDKRGLIVCGNQLLHTAALSEVNANKIQNRR